jgi:hypothetical protein
MEDESKNNKTPKRGKSSSDKKKLTPKITNDHIERLLKEALLKKIEERENQSDQEMEAMISTVQEFLRCFIIIGYNLDQEPVMVTSANSQMDADALYTALAKVFFSTNNNGGL